MPPNPPVPSPRRLNCRGLRSPLTSSVATVDRRHRPSSLSAAAPFAARCRPLPRDLRRCRHSLAAIASVAAGLRFAMHNNQPEAEAAQWRRQRGISQVNAVPRDMQYLPHPRNGGSRGYDFHTREMMVEAYRNYHHVPPLMIRSIQRWVHCLMPHQMTGNKPQSYLSGEHLLLLVYYKMIWPQASYFECIVFIANESSDSRIFNKMSISRALCSLGYTRKVTSTVAYQALTERNLFRSRILLDEPWPIGVNGS